jgi:PAS domain S-box-containing protein
MVTQRVSTVSNEVLATALSRSSEGMIVTDADQNIVFVNQAAEDLTGYSEVKMLGRNCRFLQGERTALDTVAAINRALADKATFRGLILNYRKNGHEFWNDLTITPLLGADSEATHFIRATESRFSVGSLVALGLDRSVDGEAWTRGIEIDACPSDGEDLADPAPVASIGSMMAALSR